MHVKETCSLLEGTDRKNSLMPDLGLANVKPFLVHMEAPAAKIGACCHPPLIIHS